MPPSALHRRRGTGKSGGVRSNAWILATVLSILATVLLVLVYMGSSLLSLTATSSATSSATSGSATSTTTSTSPHALLRHLTPPPQQEMVVVVQDDTTSSNKNANTNDDMDTNDDDEESSTTANAPRDDTTTEQQTQQDESPTTEQQQQQQQQIDTTTTGSTTLPYPYMPDTLVDPHHDFTTWQAPGGDRFPEYKYGGTPYLYTSSTTTTTTTTTSSIRDDDLARSRRLHVKNAMQHAWSSYERYAFGKDELTPRTGSGTSHWGGMGTTLVDSLDTLWLMGMKEEFERAKEWVRTDLDFSATAGSVSFFETTIRSLGGLLSAYDWSGDRVFLDKAKDLGDRLFHAFASPSGFPYSQVNLGTGRTTTIGWTGGSAILAEGGTCQVEFRYLAKATQTPKYATAAERAFQLLHDMNPPHGLYPYFVRISKQTPEFSNNKLTFGAMADSFYEYMLKVWLQGGKVEPMYRDMYDKSIQGMHDELLQRSVPSELTYIADKSGDRLDTKMDHLVCFMGGLLALGAYTDPLGLESERAQRDLRTGKALTYTCYQMYARMPTGIAAEFVQFHNGSDFEPGRGAPHYLLRPETVESFYILNTLTGDPIYREWGWEVFQAIERYCKTKFAYGALTDVRRTTGVPKDSMESFFLAETLKYLYLLFDPDTEVDILNKHVFNTEAHPIRMFPEMEEEAR